VQAGQFDHTQKLSSFATRAKKSAKSQGGNTYHILRAQDDLHQDVHSHNPV